MGVIRESERKERRRSWRRRKRIRKRGGFGIEKKKKDWGHGEVGYLLLVTHGNRKRWPVDDSPLLYQPHMHTQRMDVHTVNCNTHTHTQPVSLFQM